MQGKMTPPEDMSQLHDTLQAEMTEAQLRHKEYYDAGRKPDPMSQIVTKQGRFHMTHTYESLGMLDFTL